MVVMGLGGYRFIVKVGRPVTLAAGDIAHSCDGDTN
jgi:hypothetical protein